jgi:hypothetical protein
MVRWGVAWEIRSRFRFRKYLPGTRAIQVVYGLGRGKESAGVEMMSAAEFLADLEISALRPHLGDFLGQGPVRDKMDFGFIDFHFITQGAVDNIGFRGRIALDEAP